MSNLGVYWDQKKVGTLYPHKKGRVQFQYTPTWCNEMGYAVSLSLPCQKEKHAPGISTAFFENLLPENDARSVLAFNYRFDKKDTFSFLSHFGEDCAGALSIVPEEEEPDFTPGRYEEITQELVGALDRIKADPERHQLFPEMKKARLSIAGAQDKLPVRIDRGQYYLPSNAGSATTHIIKPASPYFVDIQRNEAFCMALAFCTDIDVPKSELLKIGSHEVFAIERYDRIVLPDSTVARIHQEDFCQAMGYPVNRKYEEKGGPGLTHCRQILDEYVSFQGAQPRLRLINVTLFNFLIGNHDAHGKNFSIIHEKVPQFAPFYDLLSTQVYPTLEQKFAMSIGKTFRHDRIKEEAFKRFSKAMKLRPRKLAELMDMMVNRVSQSYEPLLSAHEKMYGSSDIYHHLRQVLMKNINQMAIIRDLL